MRLMCRSGTFHFPSLIPVLALTVSATLCSCEGFLFHGCEEVTAIPLAEVRIEAGGGGEARDIRPTADGGYIIAGFAAVAPPQGASADSELRRMAYLVKTDTAGTVQWSNTFGGNGRYTGESVQPMDDGGYVTVANQDTGGLLIVKVDRDGNELWSLAYGAEFDDFGYAVCASPDGGFVVAGETEGDFYLESRSLVVRFDTEGNVLWRNTYNGPNAGTALDIIATNGGGYAIAGRVTRPEELFDVNMPVDASLIKIDEMGNVQWEGNYVTPGFGSRWFQANALVEAADGGYVLAGRGGGDLYLAKVDRQGALVWQRTKAGAPFAEALDVIEAADGSVVAGGKSFFEPFVGLPQCNDFYAVRYSADGDEQWSGRYGSGGHDVANAIALAPEGSFVLAGTDLDPFSSQEVGGNIYLITTDAR